MEDLELQVGSAFDKSLVRFHRVADVMNEQVIFLNQPMRVQT